MNKKYQVFISSTYKDLIEERAAVTQTLLDMNCIPVGMEQFPASNMKQMDYIEKMLDDCDYYILILAGKYGSCDSDGIGFTEKEYDYAVEHGIPVMSFLVDSIDNLPNKKCEQDDEGRKKLNKFREKVSAGKLIKKYANIGDLKTNIATSLSICIQNSPARGWVRGEIEASEDGSKQTLPQDEMTRRLEALANAVVPNDRGGFSVYPVWNE